MFLLPDRTLFLPQGHIMVAPIARFPSASRIPMAEGAIFVAVALLLVRFSVTSLPAILILIVFIADTAVATFQTPIPARRRVL